MRKILLPFAYLSLATAVTAAPRSLSEARSAAQLLLSQKTGCELSLKPLSDDVYNAPAQRGLSTPAEAFYVFNAQEQSAFVIVSGSDLMPAVLGYGLNGALSDNPSEWPVSLHSWLAFVTEIEQRLEADPALAASLQHAAQSTTPIQPLMTSKWGQDWPFNLQCPVRDGALSVTGCMATSISQVLYHQKYPTQPVGTYSYYDRGNYVTMNYAEHTFDFDKMLNTYSQSSSSDEQQQAVAELMHCVGHAVNMQYSPEASGAMSDCGSRGLVMNLGCTKELTLMRQYYSLDEWNAIIQEELAASRPVVLNGQSSSGGHSFVLDGLDDRGYYHVNWGWNGMADGYFDVSVLNPDDRGIGASPAVDGFASDQSIMIHVCDPEQSLKWYSPVYSTKSSITLNKTTVTLGQSLTVSTTLHNSAPVSFAGKAGLLILNEAGEVFMRGMQSSAITIDPTALVSNQYGGYSYSSYGQKNVSLTYTLPTDMADGTYRLYMCLQPTDSEDYDVVRVAHTHTSYRTFSVADGKATFTSDDCTPKVEALSWNFEEEELIEGRPSNLSVKVVNRGTETLSGTFVLTLTNPANQSETLPDSAPLTLAAGEEGTVSFTATLNASGNWNARLRVKDICVNASKLYQVDTQVFDVSPDYTLGANFSITEKLAPEGTVYNTGESTFKVKVQNSGDNYIGKMYVRLFANQLSAADKNLVAQFENDIEFDANTTESLTLTGDFDYSMTTATKKLYARLFYQKGISLVNLSSSATSVTVTKRDETGIEAVAAESNPVDYATAEIYDITGRRIRVSADNILPHGIYFINGKKTVIR